MLVQYRQAALRTNCTSLYYTKRLSPKICDQKNKRRTLCKPWSWWCCKTDLPRIRFQPKLTNKPGKSHDLEQFYNILDLKPVRGRTCAQHNQSHRQQCILGYHSLVRRRRLVFFGPQVVVTTNCNLVANYWGILDAFRFVMMEELDRYIELVLLWL